MKKQIIFILFASLSSLYSLKAQETQDNSPVIAAAARNMNIVYVGLINPVDIAVSGIPAERIQVLSDNGQVTGKNGRFFLRPDKIGSCNLTIIDHGEIIGKCGFRAKQLNDPLHVTLLDKTGGEISKKDLVFGVYLEAFFFPSDFDLDTRVVEFRIISVKDGYVKDLKKTGNKLNREMIAFIEDLPAGSPLFIEGIKLECADGTTRQVDPLSFTLSE